MFKYKYLLIVIGIILSNAIVSQNSGCTTYSVLSTGYDRLNHTPLTNNTGNFDPNWYVVKQQDIYGPPTYLPILNTEVYFSNILAYDISPFGIPVGNASYINIRSTNASLTRVIVTYRTYFDLPNPLPSNKSYSLALSMRTDDAIYQVTLNGHDLKPLGYGATGSAYSGLPLVLSSTSCDSSKFVAGRNYIDIGSADAGLSVTGLTAEVLLYDCGTCQISPPPPPPCEDCIGSFAPIPSKTYIVSGWVKETNALATKTAYTFPSIQIECPSVGFTSVAFMPAGAIIDGWQRIEGEFTIPATATDIGVNLSCTSTAGDCYFDDIRVFPTDGTMKSYVYNPINMRLEAELDERNYATIYEYDEEGKLVRVKKETEKGIMTIKENRNNSSK